MQNYLFTLFIYIFLFIFYIFIYMTLFTFNWFFLHYILWALYVLTVVTAVTFLGQWITLLWITAVWQSFALQSSVLVCYGLIWCTICPPFTAVMEGQVSISFSFLHFLFASCAHFLFTLHYFIFFYLHYFCCITYVLHFFTTKIPVNSVWDVCIQQLVFRMFNKGLFCKLYCSTSSSWWAFTILFCQKICWKWLDFVNKINPESPQLQICDTA